MFAYFDKGHIFSNHRPAVPVFLTERLFIFRRIRFFCSVRIYSGLMTATFNATNLSGGIYFSRLQINSASQVRKLVLINDVPQGYE
jgi:hypothetical protein